MENVHETKKVHDLKKCYSKEVNLGLIVSQLLSLLFKFS